MPPLVTINTIIWQNWDEIFSKTSYNWEVVLKQPYWVKSNHYLDSGCWLCKPSKKGKGLYEALHLNKHGDTKKNLSHKIPLSLKEAVNLCEEDMGNSNEKPERNLSQGGITRSGMWMQPLDITQPKEISATTLEKLRSLGLNNDYITYIKGTADSEYANNLVSKLKNCVAPTLQELKEIALLYSKPDLLSRKDLDLVRKNKPCVQSSLWLSNTKDLIFSVTNWNMLPCEKQQRRMKKATEALEGK